MQSGFSILVYQFVKGLARKQERNFVAPLHPFSEPSHQGLVKNSKGLIPRDSRPWSVLKSALIRPTQKLRETASYSHATPPVVYLPPLYPCLLDPGVRP